MLHIIEKLVITIVSHSLPHLEGGAIRDFDNILEGENAGPSADITLDRIGDFIDFADAQLITPRPPGE